LSLKVCSFDLDDTLYPEAEFVRGGLRAAEAELSSVIGRDCTSLFLSALEEGGPSRVFDRGLAAIGVQRDEALLARLVTAFRTHRPSITPHPGVIELLDALKGRGLALALITDGPLEVQQSKWAALPLGPFFDLVVFTADVHGKSCPKPDTAAFRLVEERLGAHGSEVVHAGDNPAKDFPAPDALGWRTVRVRFPQGYHISDPDPLGSGRIEVFSVRELQRVIEGMCLD